MLDQKDDPKWYPKTQNLTLGPKFFFCNKMTTARRPMDVFEIWDLILEAGIEIYNLAVSKHDLKPSATFFKKNVCDLGFAAYGIFEKPFSDTSANASSNAQVNTSVNTPVNTSVNTTVNAPVNTSVSTSVKKSSSPNSSHIRIGAAASGHRTYKGGRRDRARRPPL